MANFSPFTMFKRAMRPQPGVGIRETIAIGDRFQQSGQPLSVWVVEKISQVSTSNLPLISLSREGRPDLKKILSLSVLEDGDDFRPTLQ